MLLGGSVVYCIMKAGGSLGGGVPGALASPGKHALPEAADDLKLRLTRLKALQAATA